MATYLISFIGHLSFCLSDEIKWLKFLLLLRNNSKRSQKQDHKTNLDIKAGIWSEVNFRKIEQRKKNDVFILSQVLCWFYTREPANLISHCSCSHNILFAHYDLQYFFHKHQIYSRLTMQYHFTCMQVTLKGYFDINGPVLLTQNKEISCKKAFMLVSHIKTKIIYTK